MVVRNAWDTTLCLNRLNSPPGRDGSERFLDYQFGLGVDAGCGFIQDQNFKISRY